jgi:hypothetical protein
VIRQVATRAGTSFLALSVSAAEDDRTIAGAAITRTILLSWSRDRPGPRPDAVSHPAAGFDTCVLGSSWRDRQTSTGSRRSAGDRPSPAATHTRDRQGLFISVKTVETHVSSVLRKLQLSSRHELTRWASERRLL